MYKEIEVEDEEVDEQEEVVNEEKEADENEMAINNEGKGEEKEEQEDEEESEDGEEKEEEEVENVQDDELEIEEVGDKEEQEEDEVDEEHDEKSDEEDGENEVEESEVEESGQENQENEKDEEEDTDNNEEDRDKNLEQEVEQLMLEDEVNCERDELMLEEEILTSLSLQYNKFIKNVQKFADILSKTPEKWNRIKTQSKKIQNLMIDLEQQVSNINGNISSEIERIESEKAKFFLFIDIKGKNISKLKKNVEASTEYIKHYNEEIDRNTTSQNNLKTEINSKNEKIEECRQRADDRRTLALYTIFIPIVNLVTTGVSLASNAEYANTRSEMEKQINEINREIESLSEKVNACKSSIAEYEEEIHEHELSISEYERKKAQAISSLEELRNKQRNFNDLHEKIRLIIRAAHLKYRVIC